MITRGAPPSLTVTGQRRTVGERVEARRIELGLSQREISEPGLSYAYISRIESGSRQPSVKILRRLAIKLDTTPSWLGTGETELAEELARLVIQTGAWTLPRRAV